jgi:TolB protein
MLLPPRRLTFFMVLVAVATCATASQAWARKHQPVRITVKGAEFRAYPVAVPDVTAKADADSQAAAAAMTQLLRYDVDLARTFELVPVNTYLADNRPKGGPPAYGAWQATGASGLIVGEANVAGGQMTLTLRFDDVAAGKTLLSRTCSAAPTAGARCVHPFLDAVIAQLTGEDGVFSSRIAYVRRVGGVKAIYGSDIDGGNQEKMVQSGALSLLPAWGAAGRALYFTSYIAGGSHLYRLSTPTGRIDSISARQGLNVGAALSPDGKRVALTLTVDNNSEIYTMDVDGKNLTRLTNNLALDVSPTWSPDGTRIAFVSNRSGNPHLYVMQADGSNVRRLTFRGTYNQEPDWSPRADGQIAFTARDESLHYDLFLVHPDTSEMTRLTQDSANNVSPSFSPDGQSIAFVSDRDPANKGQVYVMDVDGQNVRAIMPGVTDCETPAWGPRLGY